MTIVPNDIVQITSKKLKSLYHVKDNDEFGVKSIDSESDSGMVTLSNGWLIHQNHLQLAVKPFNFEEAVDEILAGWIEDDKAFSAYDIIDEIKTKHGKDNATVTYWQVDNVIHKIMDGVSGYKYYYIPRGYIQVWIYYPEDCDPLTYVVGQGAQHISRKDLYGECALVLSESKQSADCTDVINSMDEVIAVVPVKKQSIFRKFLTRFGI